MTADEVFNVVEQINIIWPWQGMRLLCRYDQKYGNRLYLQIECERLDSYTHEMHTGRGGKTYLSEHMTEGEILRKAMATLLAYVEHEAREAFEYKGKKIFGPHINIDALLEIADRIDGRE